MLDNCCHGVGLGVCVAAEELRVAACSSDFALPLGFADKHSALGSGLIAHLRSRAVPGDAEAEETIHKICEATRAGRAERGALVVRAPMAASCGDDSGGDDDSFVSCDEEGDKSLLIIAVAPMKAQPGREQLFAVLLMDLAADPAEPTEQYSRHRRESNRESNREAGTEVERPRRPSRLNVSDAPASQQQRHAPVRGYAFIPELLRPSDEIYPCHGGGGTYHLAKQSDPHHLVEKLAWTTETPGAGKKAEEELSALFLEAMHAFEVVGFCLADDTVHDLPMVWVNDGFVKLSNYSRQQLIGYNCRFLQADATDPDVVGQMKDAIVAGRGVRVTLWNMTAKREGFWNCLAIYPSHDGRYFLSVQVRLSPEFHKQLVRLKRGVPSCASPMKSPGIHSSPKGKPNGPKPVVQSAPEWALAERAPHQHQAMAVPFVRVPNKAASTPVMKAAAQAAPPSAERSFKNGRASPHGLEKNATSGSCAVL